jgi:uncharacterized membrane protein
VSWYLAIKFVHILVAILAVGSSGGTAVWLRLAAKSPHHLAFALRSATLLDNALTKPGLIVMLITGLALARWSLSQLWIRAALILLIVVLLVLFLVVPPIMRKLIGLADAGQLGSPRWTRSELLFELIGGGAGLIIVFIVWLMVAKPL